jgi:hypothetical protein
LVPIGMLQYNCLKVKRTVCESGSPARALGTVPVPSSGVTALV